MDLQGYVLAAAVVMLLVYALPAVVHRRRLMAATRLEDRHSDRLRVLATVGDGGRRGRASRGHPGGVDRTATDRLTAPLLLPVGPESPVMSTIKPRLSEPARQARDLAHARSQRAARVGRRKAARARRTLYQVALGLVVVAGIALWQYAGWNVAAVLAPSVLLAAVVALSVRASAEARRLDRVDAVEIRRIDSELKQLARRPRPARASTGSGASAGSGADVRADARAAAGSGASAGSGADVQADPRAAAASASESESADPPAVDDAAVRTWATVATERLTTAEEAPTIVQAVRVNDAPDAWTPVPVPAPRWATAGDTAPRRTAPAFEAPDAPTARVPLRPTSSDQAAAVVAGSGANSPVPGTPNAPVLDLDAALARRRARGA